MGAQAGDQNPRAVRARPCARREARAPAKIALQRRKLEALGGIMVDHEVDEPAAEEAYAVEEEDRVPRLG